MAAIWDGAAGGLIGGALQYIGGIEERHAAKRMASDQNRFSESMSNTAYQRAVKDMEAAGLNPMLAFDQGGASAPPGAGYATDNLLESSAATALDMSRLRKEVDQVESNIDLNKELEETQDTQQELNRNAAKLTSAQEEAVRTTNVPEKIKGDMLRRAYSGVKKWFSGVRSSARNYKDEGPIRIPDSSHDSKFNPKNRR